MSVPRGYIDIIKDIYEGCVTNVKISCKKTSEYPTTTRLHQGSALSSYMFALLMDKLTAHIQDVHWCILFADIIKCWWMNQKKM